MINLTCWAVPVRDGYVLRADHAVASLTGSAPARNPQFWGWHITVLQPHDQMFSAPLATRAAILAVDYVRHTGDLTGDQSVRARRSGWWAECALGVVLIIISGGHWVPALAGIWLLAGRRWLRRVLGLDTKLRSLPYSPSQEPRVTSDFHAGLAKVARAMHSIEDGLVAYAAAASDARAEGLDQVAEIYESLAVGVHPAQLSPDLGFWVANEITHDTSKLALPSPRDEQDPDTNRDPVEERATR